MNIEKARLSQAEAEHEVQGDRQVPRRRSRDTRRKQGFVAGHDEVVQGRELQGQEKPGVQHGSHRDEEARELDLPGYTGLGQWQ